MVKVEVIYEGDLHTRCVHGPSGADIATDAPKDNEGKGAAFSPTDLVGTALASCMLTIMGIQARRHGWALEGARAEVAKHMVAEPRRRIGKLEVSITLPAGLPEEARPRLEAAAKGCPVYASLHPDTEVALSFHADGEA